MTMRWLVVSDTHAKPEADLLVQKKLADPTIEGLIHLGDWTWFGSNGGRQMEIWEEALTRRKPPLRALLYTWGNHEGRWTLVKGQERGASDWADPPRGAIDVTADIKVFGKSIFVGPDLYRFDRADDPYKAFWEMTSRHGIKTRVLACHYPPRGWDRLRDPDDSDELAADVLHRTQPHIVLTGHIHFDDSVDVVSEFPNPSAGFPPFRTRVINPGPWGVVLDL